MRTRPSARGSLVFLAAASAVSCTGDVLFDLLPKIHVDVCANEGVTECRASFGTVRARGSQTATLVITNRGEKELTITGAELAANTDPSITVTRVPSAPIAVNEQATIEVTFRPMVANQVSTRLVIKSDASNVPEGQDGIYVDFGGTGSDPGAPRGGHRRHHVLRSGRGQYR